MKRAIPLALSLVLLIVLVPRKPLAETAKKPSKATELVIWNYETLLMQGALLTPKGWNTASSLFQRPTAYPADGPITIVYDLTLTAANNEGEANGTATRTQGPMKWKLVGPNDRAAPIEQVISYLNHQRELTNDLLTRQNATRSITSLQDILTKLKRGRGASAC